MNAEFDEGLERGDELPYVPGKNWLLAAQLAAWDILPADQVSQTFDYRTVHRLLQLAYAQGVLAAKDRA